MPNLSRVIDSRDYWKNLAVERRKNAESKERQARKWKSRFEQTQDALDKINKTVEELKSELQKKILFQ